MAAPTSDSGPNEPDDQTPATSAAAAAAAARATTPSRSLVGAYHSSTQPTPDRLAVGQSNGHGNSSNSGHAHAHTHANGNGDRERDRTPSVASLQPLAAPSPPSGPSPTAPSPTAPSPVSGPASASATPYFRPTHANPNLTASSLSLSPSPRAGPPYAASPPASRAETPLDFRILNLPGETEPDLYPMTQLHRHHSSHRTRSNLDLGMTGMDADAGQVAETQSHHSQSSSSQMQSLLPKRGPLEDAQPALAKLERLQKRKESRIKWLHGTGQPPAKRRAREDSEAPDSPESSSIDLTKSLGEVKLGIQSLPGYSVMAVRGAASRAKSAVNRTAERSPLGIISRRSPSPGGPGDVDGDDGDDHDDDADRSAVYASLGAKLRGLSQSRHKPGRSLDAQAVHAMLSGNAGTPSVGESSTLACMRSRQSSDAPSLALAQSKSRQVSDDHTENTLPFELSRTGTGGASKLAPQSPELMAVQEEQHGEEEHEQQQQQQHNGDAEAGKSRQHPRNETMQTNSTASARIPSLHVQEPSSQDLLPNGPVQPQSQTLLQPQRPQPQRTKPAKPVPKRGALALGDDLEDDLADDTLPPATASAASGASGAPASRTMNRDNSFLGMPYHAEPEALQRESLPAPDGVTPYERSPASSSSTSLSSSTTEEEVLSTGARSPTGGNEDEQDESRDSDTEDAGVACLSLKHGDTLTNRELRRQLRRHKAIPKDVYGSTKSARAATIGHKVSRGLHYASSESRNRRAMEKYSPHPSKALSPGSSGRSPTMALTGMEGEGADGQAYESLGRASTMFSSHIPATFEGGLSAAFVPTTRSSRSGTGPRSRPTSSNDSRNSSDSDLDEAVVVVRRNGRRRSSRRFSFSPFSGSAEALSRVGSPSNAEARALPQDSNRNRHPSMASLAEGMGERSSFNLPRRWQTNRSVTSSINELNANAGPASSHLLAPRPWHFRQRRRWAKEAADENGVLAASVGATPMVEDPEKELDKVLGKLALEQAPEQTGERYEWDVLWENQRGLLFFGIPKFSARGLMQWDPAPWTDRHFCNSAYNIVNAQLPDPSWEWVYPEWLIDMAGDVDESGWQYSGNFGHNPFAKLGQRIRPLPRSGPDGNVEMNERLRKREEKRRLAEQTREDDGLEALKRSIKAKGVKWSGRPDAGSFVRRRRWIRLRRRKALVPFDQQRDRPSEGPAGAHSPASRSAAPLRDDASSYTSPTSSDSDSSLSSEMDEEDENSSSDEQRQAPPFANPSAFLPRKISGRMHNTPDKAAMQRHDRNEARELRRHRKEFTGTLRDLKHLLPSILDPRGSGGASGRSPRAGAVREKELILGQIDARNPFLAWEFIKRRLADDDLSWKTTSLRQRERHFQTRRCNYALDASGGAPRAAGPPAAARRIPSGFMPSARRTSDSAFSALTGSDAATPPQGPAPPLPSLATTGATATSKTPRYPDMFAAIEAYELTRDALVEINWTRIKRVLRACRLDRQRIDLWRLWLGLRSSHGFTSPSSSPPPGTLGIAAAPPQSNDVWDVLERRLDSVLMLFEFNAARAELLRVLLALHDSLHSKHIYDEGRPWIVRVPAAMPVRRRRGSGGGGGGSGGGEAATGEEVLRIDVPEGLNPWPMRGQKQRRGSTLTAHPGPGPDADAGAPDNAYDDHHQDFAAGLVERLQFYSDAQEIAEWVVRHREQNRMLAAGGAGAGAGAGLSSPHHGPTTTGLGLVPGLLATGHEQDQEGGYARD